MTPATSDVKSYLATASPAQGRPSWLGPPVLTLSPSDLDTACADLMRIIETGFSPGLVIGIRTGGLVVARSMVRASIGMPPLVAVTCRRPSTAAKARLPLLRNLLTTMPRSAVDLLRRVEHRWIIAPAVRQAGARTVDPADAACVAAAIRSVPAPPAVLVVDDAVDSGMTLMTVLDLVRSICPRDTDIRSAVIAQTLDRPLVAPDYVLFRGKLCRFPWSFDAAG